jgi:hypothetical protein
MKQRFQSGLNIFFVFGLSMKKLSWQKSFRENLPAIWFFTVLVLYIVLICANFAPLEFIRVEKPIVKILIYTAVWTINIITIVSLGLNFKFASAEAEFWKMTEDYKDIFDFKLRRPMMIEKFRLQALGRTIASILLFFLKGVVIVMSLKIEGTKKKVFYFGRVSAVNIFIMTVITIKFAFYVEVLHCCLAAIEMKMAERIVTIREFEIMRQAYMKCCNMCALINKIFSWCIFGFILMTLIMGVFSGYQLCYDISGNALKFRPFVIIFSQLHTVWMFIEPCLKCINCSKRIASLAFRRSASNFYVAIGDFAQQALHQRVSFEASKFFEIDQKLVMNVSEND